jgi:hypothetical protein
MWGEITMSADTNLQAYKKQKEIINALIIANSSFNGLCCPPDKQGQMNDPDFGVCRGCLARDDDTKSCIFGIISGHISTLHKRVNKYMDGTHQFDDLKLTIGRYIKDSKFTCNADCDTCEFRSQNKHCILKGCMKYD